MHFINLRSVPYSSSYTPHTKEIYMKKNDVSLPWTRMIFSNAEMIISQRRKMSLILILCQSLLMVFILTTSQKGLSRNSRQNAKQIVRSDLPYF